MSIRMLRAACLLVFLVASPACGGGSASQNGDSVAVPSGSETKPVTNAKERARLDVSFPSTALGVDKQLIVLLPPNYETSGKRYPVIYMLHGLGGSEGSWIRSGIVAAADAIALDAIIVLPDGDDSFYVNWAEPDDYDACLKKPRPFGKEPSIETYCVKKARYADYLVTDLLGYVDSTYRTLATREGRAIGGLSMGGYGALVTAFRRPDLFSSVASHAGVASLRYLGPTPFVRGSAKLLEDPMLLIQGSAAFGPHFKKVFGTDIADWISRDPVGLAPALRPGALAIYLDAGTEDIFGLQNGAAHLSEVLRAANIEHTFELIEGGKHDNSFWSTRIDDSLTFFSKRLPAPQ